MRYAPNSFSVGILMFFALVTFKKSNFKFETRLLLPIILFALMALSLCWSRDFESSLRALDKGLPLVLIPLSFLLLPAISKEQKRQVIGWYSYGMLLYTIFYIVRAAVKYQLTADSSVFFYHGLVTEDTNAIHVSAYIAVAAFYFITKPTKTIYDKAVIVWLTLFLLLLSSKNVIIVYFLLFAFYYFSQYLTLRKIKPIQILVLICALLAILSISKIRDRFMIEYQSNTVEGSVNNELGRVDAKVYNISARQAWTQENFQPNDYFAATAFRVYQIRIFMEMLHEDPIFFTGYGLNASTFKIIEKRKEHNLFEGYDEKNFHNEYVQLFAELGIFGFILAIVIVIINLKSAIKNKDFIHISFAVLMISLFLTESFLSRQRGIIFFTIMYCLFNSGIAPTKE